MGPSTPSEVEAATTMLRTLADLHQKHRLPIILVAHSASTDFRIFSGILLRCGLQPAQALEERGVTHVLDTLKLFGKQSLTKLVATHAPAASSLGQVHTASVDANMLLHVLVSPGGTTALRSCSCARPVRSLQDEALSCQVRLVIDVISQNEATARRLEVAGGLCGLVRHISLSRGDGAHRVYRDVYYGNGSVGYVEYKEGEAPRTVVELLSIFTSKACGGASAAETEMRRLMRKYQFQQATSAPPATQITGLDSSPGSWSTQHAA